MPKKLLIATHNPAKLNDYRQLLEGFDLDLVSLNDLNITKDVQETGWTLEGNARLKADAYFQLSGLPTLADDSGLEIDALDNWPGVFSRRVWGPTKHEATDEEARAEVLKRVADLPKEKRTARFVVMVVLALTKTALHIASGEAEGVIVDKPAGELRPGYPYRTIFYLPEFNKTAAELESEGGGEYLNHRKHAIIKLEPYLRELEKNA